MSQEFKVVMTYRDISQVLQFILRNTSSIDSGFITEASRDLMKAIPAWVYEYGKEDQQNFQREDILLRTALFELDVRLSSFITNLENMKTLLSALSQLKAPEDLVNSEKSGD
jgi:hypothetical protein